MCFCRVSREAIGLITAWCMSMGSEARLCLAESWPWVNSWSHRVCGFMGFTISLLTGTCIRTSGNKPLPGPKGGRQGIDYWRIVEEIAFPDLPNSIARSTAGLPFFPRKRRALSDYLSKRQYIFHATYFYREEAASFITFLIIHLTNHGTKVGCPVNFR
ncbi:hypothetical protein HNQ92_004616 [Rhabdobacter roseus]|uniref:Uncharacterized protein n=1 Tax=Rhabdobacter roseus TaxID=1655419 RepID=A0A840TQ33_9BACT|nr:hypothetical protein [Rhabdobacter roseus]